ncbi:MAG TPA: glycoside hydrolase family 28 protein [Asticcacaulis sp.]|nr:glycoside hydrolase family 28 protein [Asticcacaulis sp.]
MQLDRRFLLTAGAGALLLPAGFARAAAPKPSVIPTGQVLNVRDFGAKGDGVTVDTPAIDKAILEASKRGGGTVYFPQGNYLCYTIHMQSLVTLYLDRGAVIVAGATPLTGAQTGYYDLAEPQDPAIEPFQDYGHNHWKNSLIYGENLHDIAIIGDGMIWGKGLSNGRRDPDLPKAELPGVGNKAIALKNCFNVQLRDIKMLKCGHFAVLATGVDNLVIENLTVDTDRDGFDIDCCKNVRVHNCTVNSPYDDGICPKSSFALGRQRATENVTISDCYVSGNYVVGTVIDGTFQRYDGVNRRAFKTGRIKCGTESNGGFKNITITNCVFDECQGIALETVDGALLEDIAISNITMRNLSSTPLFLRLGRRMRGPKDIPIGVLKRVTINNITSSGSTKMPSIIAGVDGHPVEDVQISNIYFEQVGGGDAANAAIVPPALEDKYPEPGMFGPLPATGFFIRNAKNVDISHAEIVTLAADVRPGFWMQNVDGFDASFLKLPSGAPYFALDNVSGFRTFGSRAVPDKRFDAATKTSF